jgi:hypothetical protein
MTQSRFGGCDLSPLWEGTPVLHEHLRRRPDVK